MKVVSLHSVAGNPFRFGLLFVATLVFGPARADTVRGDANVWRSQQLKAIAAKVRNAESDGDRREHVARQKWLQAWEPGEMASAPRRSEAKSVLIQEPNLGELKRPLEVEPVVWQRLVSAQAKLIAIDTADDRKQNLRDIIEIAGRIEDSLSEQLAADALELPARIAWVLAFTRYRLGRALAYRELPVVRDRWPIADPVGYEKRLLAAYERLIDQTQTVRPEFILLEDRILRRSGRKGQALQLLETHQGVIEPKWYLKKRRDLLKELEWDPPYQEAARIYFDAGYRDEP